MKKIIQIIREEMDAIGGQEFFLPALNPIELWGETGRVKAFGDTMFHIKNRPLVLAPTHEEAITSIARNHIKSYKDLSQIWYQIQTKFRNEPRPKSGVLRGRQFLMKDSVSLDSSWEGLNVSYDLHAKAYKDLYSRCGLNFFIVGASSGAMGGSGSQEFMVESDAGEDTVALCDQCRYAANVEVANPANRQRPLEYRTINLLKKSIRQISKPSTSSRILARRYEAMREITRRGSSDGARRDRESLSHVKGPDCRAAP